MRTICAAPHPWWPHVSMWTGDSGSGIACVLIILYFCRHLVAEKAWTGHEQTESIFIAGKSVKTEWSEFVEYISLDSIRPLP